MKRVLLVVALAVVMVPMTSAQGRPNGITAVEGLRVGHFTLKEKPTGCTVILAEEVATGGVPVRASTPGTRETDLLDPSNLVEQRPAMVLSGGSAFGLDTASGVVRYLEERKVGFPFGAIVPAHTMGGGDTIFAIATDSHTGDANVFLVGRLAAEVMADPIFRGVREATGLPNIPPVRDLRRP